MRKFRWTGTMHSDPAAWRGITVTTPAQRRRILGGRFPGHERFLDDLAQPQEILSDFVPLRLDDLP